MERVFRGLNADHDIRPIRYRTEERVLTHMFRRMLSYDAGWRVKNRPAPILIRDAEYSAAAAGVPARS